MLKYINKSKALLLRKMSTVKNMSKSNQLTKEIFMALKEKTSLLQKEKLYIEPVEENLCLSNLETSCPLTYFTLMYKSRIDTNVVELKVVPKCEGSKGTNNCMLNNNDKTSFSTDKGFINMKEEGEEEKKNETNMNVENKKVDFFDSFVQLNIPVLKDFEKVFFYKHIIELIDSLAADVVYRHSIGVYKRNDKYNFVTVLFNNLKTYEKNVFHHEFSFALHDSYPLTINMMLKSLFYLPNRLKGKPLHPNDMEILSNFFKKYQTQNLGYIKNINEYTNIYDNEQNELVQNSNDNILTIFDSILNLNDFSFHAGKVQYACKDTYVQSNHFISSEFKNIHNFTFGGHLAYLSFCHAMVVIKKFLPKPILMQINSIQYILPVPVNSEVLYKGKVVYSDQHSIQVHVATYCFDFKKSAYYLTTICDMSFENNSDISFVPQSQEEFKLYMLGRIKKTKNTIRREHILARARLCVASVSSLCSFLLSVSANFISSRRGYNDHFNTLLG
ncbi:hypothetical protein PFHG_02680 [Plasmodium falciparum HB3]|uniref:HotDog ACOT-type domain-containing protein n=1 Tax=Plasmodium falciparum (isolate HB3) TaxID=137071 RepID=A0A0L7KC64_PLAFX|nr:hypothetical protein PFHG_02680 [Plasmodium falciparum HB3]